MRVRVGAGGRRARRERSSRSARSMFGQSINMVRCVRERDGKACGGMISIPQGDKGVCPKCGAVCGLAEYHVERGKVRNKSVQPLGDKTS